MSILQSVFDDPNYNLSYPAGDTFNVLTNVNTLSVTAHTDITGTPQDLLIGASKNINLEAVTALNLYVEDSNAVTFYNTEISDTLSRTDIPILQLFRSNVDTFLNAPNMTLSVSGGDTSMTTTVSKTKYTYSNLYQVISLPTDHVGNGFIFAPPTRFMSNLDVTDSIVSHNNIACSGNIFSSTLNLYKDRICTSGDSNTQIAYAFYINKYDQLELIRFNKYTTDGHVSPNPMLQRIATFGKNNMTKTADPYDYTALNEFNSIPGQQNGQVTNISMVSWTNTPNGSDIFYNTGSVGIGIMQPIEKLDIQGNIRVGGTIYPSLNEVYDLGTSNMRFKD